MSSTFFAAKEWDGDVPENEQQEVLGKRLKLKKIKKTTMPSENTQKPLISSKNKRPHEEEAPSKKKKKRVSESYIKFESPRMDSTINSEDRLEEFNTHFKKRKEKNNKQFSNTRVENSKSNEIENHEKPTKDVCDFNKKENNSKKKMKVKSIAKSEMLNSNSNLSNNQLENGDNVTKKVNKNKKKKLNKRISNEDADSKSLNLNNNTEELNDSKHLSKQIVISSATPKEKMFEDSPTKEELQPRKTKIKKSHSFVSKISALLDNSKEKNMSNKNIENTSKEDIALLEKLNESTDVETQRKKPKSLRERMLERIRGARFRYLNEQFYLSQSTDANSYFKEDPDAFKAYHEGYKQQVDKWPLNPLDVIIADIKKIPKDRVIADLGCGDAHLAKSLHHKVYSFDLVAIDPLVNACDMAHTPLLSNSVDVVVFCLSLMGTNLLDYIIEASRILKIDGILKIAEVESRFENIEQFINDLKKCGFCLTKKDLSNNLFYFMDFKKENDVKKRNKLPQLTLKPCLYKKR